MFLKLSSGEIALAIFTVFKSGTTKYMRLIFDKRGKTNYLRFHIKVKQSFLYTTEQFLYFEGKMA